MSMRPWKWILLCAPLVVGCDKTTPVQNSPESVETAVKTPEQGGGQASNEVTELTPDLSGTFSANPKDADGKDLTRVEYRYLNKSGVMVSVVANVSGVADVTVTEIDPAGSEPKTFKKGRYSSVNVKQLDKFLHQLDTYGQVTGPLMWVGLPERADWSKDDSTTWIIMDYGETRFVVSSRQQLPEHRYKGFNTIYTYLTSFVPGFERKMRQDIGEPAQKIVKTVHDKPVALVPGTGSTALTGAELDYGDKLWWVEEEFVGKFVTTESAMLAAKAVELEGFVAGVGEITIDAQGNFTMKDGEEEYIGSLRRERLYQTMAKGVRVLKTPESLKQLEVEGKIKNGERFDIDYDTSSEVEALAPYTRLRIEIEGTPYVEGVGAVSPRVILLDRQ